MHENADFANSEFPTPKDRNKGGKTKTVAPILWLTAVFLCGIVVGNLLWIFASDVLAFGRADSTVSFTVSKTDALADVSRALKEAELIDHPWLFRLYVRLTGAQSKIRPGTYELHGRYDYHALVKALSAGKVQKTKTDETNRGDRTWQNSNY